MKRRLATIMVADVVGFSGMMEANEERTARQLSACRQIFDTQISQYDGRLFKAMGDAFLVEFSSPISALHCAVAIRAALAMAASAEQPPFRMRFGVHLADILIEGDDLLGDGINLAARIQQAADADAIDISASLFEQIKRNSPFSFDDRGEQTFKNINEPIRIFRLRGAIDRGVYQIASTQPAPVQSKRLGSIAVTRFEVPADHEDQRFLADGLVEELIFELGRFRRLFVSSRTATLALGVAALEPRVVGEKLGVHYVLTGSLRRFGSRIRLSLSLCETEAGGVVWTDRLDQPLEGLIEQLDELVSRIASTVLGRVEANDIALARRLRPDSMTAYELHLRGLDRHRLGGVIDNNYREAAQWFERSIAADETFARPWAMLVCALSGLPDFDLDNGERLAQHALELDPNDPEGARIMSVIRLYRRDFDGARRHVEKALTISPSDAYIRSRASALFIFLGEPKRALQLLDEADQLDPFLPVWCVEERVVALFASARYDETIETAMRLPFQTRRSRLYRAAAQVALGDLKGARYSVAEAIAHDPALSSAFLTTSEHYRDTSFTLELTSVLASVGLPA